MTMADIKQGGAGNAADALLSLDRLLRALAFLGHGCFIVDS
jgi:hypothetical protein